MAEGTRPREAPPASRLSGALRLLLPAAVALPLLVTAAGAWLAWRQAWREAEQDVVHAANASAEYAGRVFDGLVLRIDRANDILAGLTDAEVIAREPALHRALQRAAAGPVGGDQRPPYLYVYDREARPLVSGSVFPVPRNHRFDQREFNQALRGPDAPALHVSPVYTGSVTGEPFFAVTRRREWTGNGLPPAAYDGIVNASVYVRDTAATLRRLAVAETGDVLTLMRADGEILVRSLEVPPGTRVAPGSPLLQAMRLGEDRAIFSGASTLDGTRRIAAYRRVEGYPVYASAARPQAAVLRRWGLAVLPLLAAGLPATLALLGLAVLVRRGQMALAEANAGLERRVAARTAALSESEAGFRAAIEGAPFPMMLHAEDGAVLALSRSWTELTGYGPGEMTRHADWTRLAFGPAQAADREAAHRAEFAAGGATAPGELEIRIRGGGRRIWDFHSVPVGALPDGQRLRVSAAIDVTGRRQAEERQALLTREVDHRAKNALAVVQAALRLTPREDPAAFAAAVEARVAALARTQVLLAEASWRGADLRSLAEGALAAFLTIGSTAPSVPPGDPGASPRAELEGPALNLAATAAQPISLVLHELATNAVKYGALSAAGGVVVLSWACDSAAGLLRLRWAERGGPPVAAPPQRRGFGSRVVETTIGTQLGGRVAQRWDAVGLVCDMELPLDRTVVAAG